MEIYFNKYATASLAAIIVTMLLLGVVMAGTGPFTETTTASVTVKSFLSVTFTNYPVTFPDMDPGTGPTAADVGNGYPLTATIGPESNVDAKVDTRADGTDFCTDYPECTGTGGEYKFAVINLEWDEATIGPWTDYDTVDATVCANVAPGSDCDIYHQLTIPPTQAAGSYSVGITITATSV